MRTLISFTSILLTLTLSLGILTFACDEDDDKSELEKNIEEAAEELEKALDDLRERLDLNEIDPEEALAELRELGEDIRKNLEISEDEMQEVWEDLNQSLQEFSDWLNEAFADVWTPAPTRQPTSDTSGCGSGEAAEFKVSNLRVTVEEAFLGNEIEITVDIRNVGDCSGTHTLVSKIDGGYVGSYNVTLNPGESGPALRLPWTETQLSLSSLTDFPLNPSGEHTVCVDDLCETVQLNP